MTDDAPPAGLAPRPLPWRLLARADGPLIGCLSLGLLLAHLCPQSFEPDPGLVVIPTVCSLVLMVQLHVGLVGLALAGSAAWRRRWVVALGALPLLLVCLAPTAWKYRPRADPPPVEGRALTVMTANLLMVNRELDGILGEVRAADPDLLVLVEFAPQWDRALSPLRTRYPHRMQVVREDAFGLALWSKAPLARQMALPLLDGRLPQFRAELTWEGQRVALYAVHLIPPRRLELMAPHRAQFGDLLRLLEAEQGPALVVGDFNFTERSPLHDRLQALGFLDPLDVVGWGRETTWPVHPVFGWLPSMRLDHVYARGFVPLAARVGAGRGSDHRPIVSQLAFAPRGS